MSHVYFHPLFPFEAALTQIVHAVERDGGVIRSESTAHQAQRHRENYESLGHRSSVIRPREWETSLSEVGEINEDDGEVDHAKQIGQGLTRRRTATGTRAATQQKLLPTQFLDCALARSSTFRQSSDAGIIPLLKGAALT